MSNNTEEQAAAICDNNRFLAVLASAGSGKTRTLVQRISREVYELGSSPSELIAFTFTNKAADDLKTRVYQRIAKNITVVEFSKMFVGTIHGYCNQFLKGLDNYHSFDVLDELQFGSLVYRVHDDIGLQSVYGHTIRGNIDAFTRDYEIFENELLEFEDLPKKISTCIRGFCTILQSNRLLTFGSMIRHASEEIEKQGGLENLKHLFVDEYQDINPAQNQLIKAMVKKGAKLTVVGDDLQSIYQWRGSDVSRIINFKEEWSGETHILSNNFRSREDIVNLADFFSKTIEPRFKEKSKTMVPTVEYRKSEQNAFWLPSNTEVEQNSSLVTLLKRAFKEGYSPNEIAILVRSVRRSAPPIMNLLKENSIPVFCPQISFVEGSTINNMFIPLFRLFASKEPKNSEEETKQDELFDRFRSSFEALQPNNDFRRKGQHVITEWSQAIKAGKANAYNIRSWLFHFLDESKLNWGCEDVNLLVQMGLLTQIIRSAEEVNRRSLKGIRRKSLREVYSHLSYILEYSQEEELIPIDNKAIKNVNAVFLSTVHQVKGLEFPIVFLLSIAHKRFPIQSRSHGTSFEDKIAARYGTTDVDERRLFYVALTRAKDHLVIESFKNNGKDSSFLCNGRENMIIKPESSPKKINFCRNDVVEDKDEEITSIGISDLLILMECPFQYYLRRVFGIYPPVGDELGYGRSLHETIQRSIRNGEWVSPIEIAKAVDKYAHIPLEGEKQFNIHKKAIENRVQGLSKIKDLTKIKDIEIPIRFYLNNVEVVGVVDTYTENEDNEITLIDWKTSISDKFLDRYQRQLQLYSYAMRELGMHLIGASLIDVNQTSALRQIVKTDVPIDEKEVANTVANAAKELSRLKSPKFDAYSSKTSCQICDVKEICKFKFEGA
jgi:DNA helicase-2/ATP-dependent DNA helicase PcrA